MKTEQELKDIFGKNVKTRRESRKWSQEFLSEKVNVSKNTISDIESDHKFVHAKTLINFAIAFETEVYELFKPPDVLPDKSIDIFAKFNEEIRKTVEKIGNSYIEKMKR